MAYGAISFAGIWSRIKVLDKFWTDGGSRWKVRGSPKLILWGTWMSPPNFGNSSNSCQDLWLKKPKMSTSWWRWRKSQGITKVLSIYPPGTMNVSTRFHGSPSNICWHISVWTKVMNRPTNIAAPRVMPLVKHKTYNTLKLDHVLVFRFIAFAVMMMYVWRQNNLKFSIQRAITFGQIVSSKTKSFLWTVFVQERCNTSMLHFSLGYLKYSNLRTVTARLDCEWLWL